MNVLVHPAHHRYRCADTCTGCCICSGGLFSCTRCRGGEASLPEDCPGEPMTEEQQEGVMQGRLDFRRKWGGWVTLDARGQMVTDR